MNDVLKIVFKAGRPTGQINYGSIFAQLPSKLNSADTENKQPTKQLRFKPFKNGGKRQFHFPLLTAPSTSPF